MKTIEKRAFEYGKNFIIGHSGYEAFAEQEDVTRAYIDGAIDQHKIDIDKVCQALCTFCHSHSICNDDEKCFKKTIIRKAMEE